MQQLQGCCGAGARPIELCIRWDQAGNSLFRAANVSLLLDTVMLGTVAANQSSLRCRRYCKGSEAKFREGGYLPT